MPLRWRPPVRAPDRPASLGVEAFDVAQDLARFGHSSMAASRRSASRIGIACGQSVNKENAMFRTFVRRLVWITMTLCCMGSTAPFAQNHTTIKTYQDGAFALGFTHIVNTPGGILYYN